LLILRGARAELAQFLRPTEESGAREAAHGDDQRAEQRSAVGAFVVGDLAEDVANLLRAPN
jgi:hypothetical protein